VLSETSGAVAATRSRLEKVRLLAGFLRDVEPEERRTAVAWLSGVHPGGRLGIGGATVRALRDTPPAESAVLSIGDARRALDALRGITGKGSAERRRDALAALLKSATDVEQRFLVRLLLGELRQGALE